MNIVTGLGSLSDRLTRRMVRFLEKTEAADLIDHQLGTIRRAQLEAILATSKPMMLANLANAVSLLMVEVHAGTLTLLTCAWSLLVVAFAVSGLRSAVRFQKPTGRTTSGIRTPGKLVISAIIIALIWCYPLIFILPTGGAVQIAFISALTAGLVAGGALALYPVPLAGLLHTLILSVVAFVTIVFSGVLPPVPFAIVIIAFAFVVTHSVLRHTGMFLSEMVERLEAQRQSDIAHLLMDVYQGNGGQYLWRCDPQMRLTTDPEPLLSMLRLPVCMRPERDLITILADLKPRPLPSGTVQDRLDQLLTSGDRVEMTFKLEDNRTVEFVGRRESDSSLASNGFHGYIKDTTAETKAAEEIRRLATRDTMTGLLNYREFRTQAEYLIANDALAEKSVVFLFVDADNLKAVNDNFGHAAGDQLILEIAVRLRRHLPEGGLLARKGGDEFVALFPLEAVDDLASWSAHLSQKLCVEHESEQLRIPVSCCGGISRAPIENINLNTLELEADRALYHAKSQGKGQIRLYNDRIGHDILRERVLANDFHMALGRGDLMQEYQPIFGPDGCKIVGAEALLRWTHPVMGPVAPEKIVSIAQSEGLGMALFEQVLSKATQAAKGWSTLQFVSVNVSPADLNRCDLVQRALSILDRNGFPPSRLWLEVIESETLQHLNEVRTNLNRLRAAGIQIAIDDFGSGYSSLSWIGTVPADVIKVDRSLVKNCDTNPGNRIIVQAVKSLASVNGLRLVAEGAETLPEATFLSGQGFDMIQGFALGRPMSAEDIGRLLRTEATDCAGIQLVS